jgi:hypothetical protein
MFEKAGKLNDYIVLCLGILCSKEPTVPYRKKYFLVGKIFKT